MYSKFSSVMTVAAEIERSLGNEVTPRLSIGKPMAERIGLSWNKIIYFFIKLGDSCRNRSCIALGHSHNSPFCAVSNISAPQSRIVMLKKIVFPLLLELVMA
jgi:hypothetical protein